MRILIREITRWCYWYPFRMVAEQIPLRLTYPLVKLTAWIGILIPQVKLRRIYEGLQKSFPEKPEKELRKLTYKTFENYLLNACEAFWYPKLSKKMIQEMVEYEGLEKIDAALKSGKGVILAHGHFGNEEILMPGIGYMGYKTHQLASRWKPEPYNGYFAGLINYIRQKAFEKRIGYRETFPVTFHYVDKTLRSAIESLQKNEVLLFAVDGREGTQWEDIRFINRCAKFSRGMVKIARMTGAVVLPVFIIRQRNCQHRIVVHDPIPIDKRQDREILIEFFQLLDSYVNSYPEQYAKVFFLVNDVFKD